MERLVFFFYFRETKPLFNKCKRAYLLFGLKHNYLGERLLFVADREQRWQKRQHTAIMKQFVTYGTERKMQRSLMCAARQHFYKIGEQLLEQHYILICIRILLLHAVLLQYYCCCCLLACLLHSSVMPMDSMECIQCRVIDAQYETN